MILFFLLQVSITILLNAPIVLMRHVTLLIATGESYFRTMLCYYRNIYVITMANKCLPSKIPNKWEKKIALLKTVSDYYPTY